VVLLAPEQEPINGRCVVNLDSIESVSISILSERIGRLSDRRMREICEALNVAVGYGDYYTNLFLRAQFDVRMSVPSLTY
jgi:mRNA interferase MazF